MAAKISAEIKGLKETQRQMEKAVRDLRSTPIVNAMRDSTLYITRDAKINVPVDTGRLRASLIPDVTNQDEIVQGVVGTEVTYAPYVEFNEKARHKVGKAHYLQGAYESNKDKIIERFEKAIAQITRDANK